MMKNFAVLGTTLCMGMLLASCGSSKESAYRKAYEKARAQEATCEFYVLFNFFYIVI